MLSKRIIQDSLRARCAFSTMTTEQVAPRILNTEFGLKGSLSLRGEVIQRDIKKFGAKKNFDEVTFLNLGNPHATGQSPLTFNRKVMTGLINPRLTKIPGVFTEDELKAYNRYTENLSSPPGAYTASAKGYAYIRKKIANYINERDGVTDTDPESIYLCNGATEALRISLNLLVEKKSDAVLIPIPQYPVYSALLQFQEARQVQYFLNEGKTKWTLDTSAIEEVIINNWRQGIKVKGIVVINPGNPTGHVLSKDEIKEIIKICHTHKVLIYADEVYQDNVFHEEFHSFNKVLHEMGPPYSNSVELKSPNSVSKGIGGECGMRGGYIELRNISPAVHEQMLKLKSVELCANTIGQVMTGLMVDPPKDGRESAETVKQYWDERNGIMSGLKERATLLTKSLNEMDKITCCEIQGAMYGFPRLHLSQSAIDAAAAKNMAPDAMYCLDLLEETGILCVPGSGFGQKEGTYHLRITNLVTPTSKMEKTLERFADFNKKFHQRYQ